ASSWSECGITLAQTFYANNESLTNHVALQRRLLHNPSVLAQPLDDNNGSSINDAALVLVEPLRLR
ncbi:unnamed protein product, partial [Dovyalis caffra]